MRYVQTFERYLNESIDRVRMLRDSIITDEFVVSYAQAYRGDFTSCGDEIDECVREHLDILWNAAIESIEDATSGNVLTAYRMILVDRTWTTSNLKHTGLFWTTSKHFGATPGRSRDEYTDEMMVVRLTAEVSYDDVNWEQTLLKRLDYENGVLEQEVEIHTQAQPKVVLVEEVEVNLDAYEIDHIVRVLDRKHKVLRAS